MERYQAIKYVSMPLQEFDDEPELAPKPLFYDPEDRQLFVRPLHERTPSRLDKLRKASQLDPSPATEGVSHEQEVRGTERSQSAEDDTSRVGLRGGFLPTLSDDVYAPAPHDTLRPAIRGYGHRRSLSSPQKAFSRLSPVKEIPSIPRKPLRSPPMKNSPTKPTDSPTLPRKLLPGPARRSPKKFSVTPRRSLSAGAPILSPTRFQGSPYAASHWASPPTPDLPKRYESSGAGQDQPLSFRRGLLWDNFSPFQHESLDRTGTTSRLADSFSNVSIQKRPATDLSMRGDSSVPPAEEPRTRIASQGSVNGMRELGLRPSSRSDGVVDFKKLNLRGYKDPQPERMSRIPKNMLKVPITDMVKEGWFKPNDVWIYARRVKAPKEEVYIYKEMPVLKANKDGTIALAIPKGDLKKIPEKDIPESSARIPRKPIPPPHGSTEPPPRENAPPNYDSLTAVKGLGPTALESLAEEPQFPATPQSAASKGTVAQCCNSAQEPSTPTSTTRASDLPLRRYQASGSISRNASVRASPRHLPPILTGPRQPPSPYGLRWPRGAVSTIAPPPFSPAGPRRLPSPASRASRTTDTSDFTIVETKLLQDLERRIFELDGRVSSSRVHEGGANVWRTIRCARDGEDRGSLWEMRQRCAAGWKRESEAEGPDLGARMGMEKGMRQS